MPIYDYACSVCGHVTEVIHGINDPGPKFCPTCGAEGSMRKALSAPAVVFKGSGWAKVDRRSATSSRSSAGASSGAAGGSSESTSGDAGGSNSPGDATGASSPKASSEASRSSGSSTGSGSPDASGAAPSKADRSGSRNPRRSRD